MLTVIEKVLLLQDVDFFEFGYTEHLAQLAAVCKETQVSAGTALFREGEACNRFQIVIKGEVTLEKQGEFVQTVEQGGLDFWSFFSESPHQFTAIAASSTELLTISFEDTADLLTAEPEFCWAILKRLAAFGRQSVEKHSKPDSEQHSKHEIDESDPA